MRMTLQQEQRLIARFLEPLNMPEADAKILGEVVSHSDFTGVYSHGLSRFMMYVRQLQAGALNPRPDIRKIRENGAVVTYDCDHASGIVAVNRVYDDLVERARQYGIAAGCGMHAANIGCGNYYGQRAAADNMLCILMCNTLLAMAPYGGADRLIGTNPIIMACPTDSGFPLVLDISTSNVAMGKISSYKREGKPIPLGWANDEQGRPTTDASAAYAVTPIGGHKGYGLAVFVDIFSAVLAGASFGTEIKSVFKLQNENTGFAMILMDIEHFLPLDEFKRRASEYVTMIKESRPAEGVKEIFLPGEIEFRKHEQYLREGLEVSDATCAALQKLAVEMGLLGENESIEKLMA